MSENVQWTFSALAKKQKSEAGSGNLSNPRLGKIRMRLGQALNLDFLACIWY
ncbi:hypothetical protein STRDD10_01353 [Streptococcus sp. DD10]|nr:hypothetical protein STRDD10_01353 [Streptococcus sp. DD10]